MTKYNKKIRILAGIEVSGDIDTFVAGGKKWAPLVDGLYSICAGDDAAGQYKEICKRLPGVIVIPGIKTSPILKHDGLDNMERWAELVDTVNSMGNIHLPVYLEHESSLENYVCNDNPLPIKWKQFSECVGLFGSRELWWYPSMVSNSESVRLRYKHIAWWAGRKKGIGNTRFVDLSIFYNSLQMWNSVGSVELRTILDDATPDPLIPAIYNIKDKWSNRELPMGIDFISHAFSDVKNVILYPEHEWLTAPDEIARLAVSEWLGVSDG